MSRTASYVKDRYNVKTYDRYTFYIRKDDPLNTCLQANKHDIPISHTVKDSLLLYFKERLDQTGTCASTRSKNNSTPAYKTKRQRRAAMKAIINQLEQILTAQENSRDNIPDNLHSSPAFEAAEVCISALSDSLDLLRDAY